VSEILNARTRLVPGQWFRDETNGLFVNHENDASFFAHHPMTRSRGVDDEGSGLELALGVFLRAGKDNDVLKARVFVEWDLGPFAIAEERRGRASDSIAVDPVDLDAVPEWFPRNTISAIGEMEEAFEGGRRRLGHSSISFKYEG
jgi:hypothetical protein